MQTRTELMPCILSLFLSVVVVTTTTRANTPFFWDDFDRESLDGGDIHWEKLILGAGEVYLEHDNLNLKAEGAGNRTDAFARIPPVGDFSIRTQIGRASCRERV